ncbi:MAG TPA: hypothetical protein VGR22_00495 [Thermomicrobiales bacterium]|nr:hypothetical protein [Thermomicrobiales bacterium]
MPDITVKPDVAFAGDNPLLMLYRPDTEEVIAVASYWRCAWSPEGAGEALVIWVDPAASGLDEQAPAGIFADNTAMAHLVWVQFNSQFDRLQGRGIEDREIQPARFTMLADGIRLHRVTCAAGATTIELEWRDALEAVHMVATPRVGSSRWEVTNVVLPCAGAAIRVDGIEIAGEVHQPEGIYRSSAFLAFAESWVRLADAGGES